MICKLGETTKLEIKDKTLDGIFFNILMKGDAVNTTLSALTDFIAKEVALKVTLSRENKITTVMADNLLILGIYSSLNYDSAGFYRGHVINYADADEVETKLITCYIPFGGHINNKGKDKTTIEVNTGLKAFSDNVNQGVSYVAFEPHYSIGYELGTPITKSYTVNPNQTNDNYQFGDNVVKLAFINLDKDNIEDNVISTLSIGSKQWDQAMDFFTLLNHHWNTLASPVINWRYGNTQPVTGGNEAFPYIPYYPQSVCLFAGSKDVSKYLDECNVYAQFNSDNVVAGKNIFIATQLEMSAELVEKANDRMNKHSQEKLNSLPA